MTTAREIDLESALRLLAKQNPEQDIVLRLSTNAEKRVVIHIIGDQVPDYVVFGNNVAQFPPPKPPTQVAGIRGFDSLKPGFQR